MRLPPTMSLGRRRRNVADTGLHRCRREGWCALSACRLASYALACSTSADDSPLRFQLLGAAYRRRGGTEPRSRTWLIACRNSFPLRRLARPDYLRALAFAVAYGIRFCPTGSITAATALDGFVGCRTSYVSAARGCRPASSLRAGDWAAVERLGAWLGTLRAEGETAGLSCASATGLVDPRITKFLTESFVDDLRVQHHFVLSRLSSASRRTVAAVHVPRLPAWPSSSSG